MKPRACPLCGGLFIASGLHKTQFPLDPTMPILAYRKRSGFPVGACPHCDKRLTSDAFPVGGQLIPWNAPMLEAEVQDVAEGTPLRESAMAGKMSQDDVPGWVEARNRQAALDARKKWRWPWGRKA